MLSEKKDKSENSKMSVDEIVSRIAKGSKKPIENDNEIDATIVLDSEEKPHKKIQKNKNIIDYNDVDFGKLDDGARKTYSELFSGMPDIYAIIGASPNDTQDDIKRKCNKKISKYHPDKIAPILEKCAPNMREKEKKDLAIKYKLVREAAGILSDPVKRKHYDLQKRTTDSKNFVKQKSSFEDFVKVQESEINEKSRENAKNNFQLEFMKLDEKRGFDRAKLEDSKLTKKDIDKRMQDLLMERETQDIEYTPTNMFEGRSFNPKEFHKTWDKQKRKEEKRAQNGLTDRSVMIWGGVSAADDAGVDGSTQYISVEADYGELYREVPDQTYAGKLESPTNLDDQSCSSGSEPYEDYDAYNKNKGSVEEEYAKRMKEWERENQLLEKRKFTKDEIDPNPFEWKDVLENPMNVSAQMGTMIGKDVAKTIQWKKQQKRNLDKDTIEAYKQLKYEEEH